MQRNQLSKSTRLKNIAQKILIILMILVLSFSVINFKPKQTEAAVVPLVGGAAVATYVIGALAVSAIALHIGHELNNEELTGVGEVVGLHADVLYQKSTQEVKDAWDTVYQNSLATGEAVTYLPDILKTFLADNTPAIVAASSQVFGNYKLDTDLNYSTSLGAIGIGPVGHAKAASLHANGWMALYTKDGVTYFVDAISLPSTGGNILVTLGGANIYDQIPSLAEAGIRPASGFTRMSVGWKESWDTFSNKTTFSQIMADLNVHLPGLRYYQDELWKGNSISTSVNQELPKMDAGLVIPVREFEISTPDGVPLTRDTTGNPTNVLNPDGTTYQGDVVYTPSIPDIYVPKDASGTIIGNPTISIPIAGNPVDVWTGNPAVPIQGEIPGGGIPGTDPPPGGSTPKPPGSTPIVPIALLLGLFDLLRAILMYLARMFTFLVTLPFVTAIPIENPYFQWFRTAKILGVQPYPLVMTMATFFMSFAAFKSIRRFLP